jgi:hypothetical protein
MKTTKQKLLLKVELSGKDLFDIIRDYTVRVNRHKPLIESLLDKPGSQYITRMEFKTMGTGNIFDMGAVVEIMSIEEKEQ